MGGQRPVVPMAYNACHGKEGFKRGRVEAYGTPPASPSYLNTSAGTCPALNSTRASASSPMLGSPVRENAIAPAFVAARCGSWTENEVATAQGEPAAAL